jgi:hypothetical protein
LKATLTKNKDKYTDRERDTHTESDIETNNNKVQGIVLYLFSFEKGQFGKSMFTVCKVLFE